tara:strand:- start:240 stop:797 length:558 start_codon:yes stop_codon:yes gene_type:complete
MSTNKSFSNETSERYSRALFEVSKDSDELDKVESDVKNFQFLLNSSLDIENLMKDPTLSIENQNVVINLISEKFKFSKTFKNFLLFLIEKRRIFFVNKILNSFIKICLIRRGELEASLISSKELSQPELENISKDLSASLGSKLKFNYKVDEKLIGGFKLQLGSFMIDTSIKNKLKKYELAMIEN